MPAIAEFADSSSFQMHSGMSGRIALILLLGVFSVLMVNTVPTAHASSITDAAGFDQLSFGSTNATTTTSPEHLIQVPVTSTSTSNSSLGLRLVLNLSTVSSPAGNLSIRLTAVNLRNTTNIVPYADRWGYSLEELSGSDACAFGASLAFGMFSGNLSLEDLQTATPLPLYNTSVQFACTESTVPTTFPPLGNESVGQSTAGYWTGGAGTSISAAPITFPPGTYTVVGEDEWSQFLLLHFTVSQATATSSSSGTSTSTPGTTLSSTSNMSSPSSSLSQTSTSTANQSSPSASSLNPVYFGVLAVVALIMVIAMCVAILQRRR